MKQCVNLNVLRILTFWWKCWSSGFVQAAPSISIEACQIIGLTAISVPVASPDQQPFYVQVVPGEEDRQKQIQICRHSRGSDPWSESMPVARGITLKLCFVFWTGSPIFQPVCKSNQLISWCIEHVSMQGFEVFVTLWNLFPKTLGTLSSCSEACIFSITLAFSVNTRILAGQILSISGLIGASAPQTGRFVKEDYDSCNNFSCRATWYWVEQLGTDTMNI